MPWSSRLTEQPRVVLLREPGDRLLLDAIRALPRVEGVEEAATIFEHADGHGLAGVLFDAWQAAGVTLPAELARHLAIREAAREIDHAAHVAMLRRIDEALAIEELRAVVLKGALLAERLYRRPAARFTTDIDLLVAPDDLERALAALRGVGYEAYDGPEEEHFRRAGHHLHLYQEGAPPLELHFHAYRGFGEVLAAPSLIARSEAVEGFAAIRALAPDDELLYLAVHAAAHRFSRLGWLYDLELLLRRHGPWLVDAARERARVHRLAAPLAFALEELALLLGFAHGATGLPAWRRALLVRITEEPRRPLLRSLTRFVYSLALCEDLGAAQRYARAAVGHRARRALAS